MRIEHCVPQIVIRNSVERVSTGTGDDVDYSTGEAPEFGVEVGGEQAKLFQRIGIGHDIAATTSELIVVRAVKIVGVQVRPESVYAELRTDVVTDLRTGGVVSNTSDGLH